MAGMGGWFVGFGGVLRGFYGYEVRTLFKDGINDGV